MLAAFPPSPPPSSLSPSPPPPGQPAPQPQAQPQSQPPAPPAPSCAPTSAFSASLPAAGRTTSRPPRQQMRYTRPAPRHARHPRPADRPGARGAARPGLGAARRHPGTGRRRLDHRRRAQRHRPGRSPHRPGPGLPLPPNSRSTSTPPPSTARRIWFTGQTGVYGRLDPRSGEMRVWRDPEGRGPYGIAATPSGEIYYVSLAGSHLARVDRETGEATIIEPPTADQGARRVWADRSGNLWVSEWNGGQLSRYDPATPGNGASSVEGERPRVYAVYVDDRDIVWISDFGANAVLSFDPATERWTRYPGSGGNASVRQILGAPRLEIYLPESGLDRIMVRPHRARPVKRSVGVLALWGCGLRRAGGAPAVLARRDGRGAGAGRARLPPPLLCAAMPSSPAATRRRDRRCTTSPGGRSPPNRASITRPPCAGWPSTMGSWADAARPLPRRSGRGRARTEMGFPGLEDEAERRAVIHGSRRSARETEVPQALAPAAARPDRALRPASGALPPCTSPHMGEVWRFPIRRGAASSSRAAAADEGDDHAQ